MWKSYRAELQKSRRRWDWPVAAGIALLALLWNYTPHPRPELLAIGYQSTCYVLPVLNAIIMPIGMAALASRIWDAETKGQNCKLLFTLQSRSSLFAGKAALGLTEILLICLLETGGAAAEGRLMGYTDAFPLGRFGWLFLCTFAVNAMLYFFLLVFSIRVQNQIAPLALGFCGALIGLFAAYMPRAFGYFIPFGYYVSLMAVGSSWDRTTRISSYFWRPLPWWLLGITLALGAGCALLCRRALVRKEV